MPESNTSDAKAKKSGRLKVRKVTKFIKPKNRFSQIAFLIIVLIVVGFGVRAIYSSFADSTTINVNAPVVGITDANGDDGYILAGNDGGVFAEGSANFEGSYVGVYQGAPGYYGPASNYGGMVAIAETENCGANGGACTPSNAGYYLLSADGHVWTFGNAKFHGSGNGSGNDSPFVGMAVSANGGYWLVDKTGQVYGFGDPGCGSANCNSPADTTITGIASSYNGYGYQLVASQGQVYAFGDAGYQPTNSESGVVGIAEGVNLDFYEASDTGGVFAYNTPFYGSMGGQNLNGKVVGIASTADSGGYWLAASDGGVFAFGDAKFLGTVVYTSCPSGDTGTPTTGCVAPAPKTNTNTGSTATCPSGDTGTPTTGCVAPLAGTTCPSGDTGTYPNCVAPLTKATSTNVNCQSAKGTNGQCSSVEPTLPAALQLVLVNAAFSSVGGSTSVQSAQTYTNSTSLCTGKGGCEVQTATGVMGPNYTAQVLEDKLVSPPSSGTSSTITCVTYYATDSLPIHYEYACADD